ncbi:hypothetical protein B0O99DRAFT_696566 [Bisporella sp. PMI_857]|nr:hypothetical protein B0O99DRAFT_696566 [Bisporella sp. PMI_857]
MTSTIGTRSIQYLSIFSSSESYLSRNTEWSCEVSAKLVDDGDKSTCDGQEKSIRLMGRPPNKWTSTSLHKLIRLYLLTDLELDSIIVRLRTKGFQPCRRNVQEKLNLLLQPKPNKIRPKGATSILRRLLLECRHLQKARRLRKQRRRCRDEQQGHLQGENGVDNEQRGVICEQGPFSTANSSVYANLSYTSNMHPLSLESLDHEQNFPGAISPGMEALDLSLRGDHKENHHTSKTTALKSPTHRYPNSGSVHSISLPEWVLQDPASQSERLDNEPLVQGTSHLTHDSWNVMDSYDDLGFDDPLLNFGFGSEFGSRIDHPFPEPGFIPTTSGLAESSTAACERALCHNVPQSSETIASSLCNPLAASKFPIVNPTYIRDNCDPYWGSDFDAPNLKRFEVPPPQLDVVDPSSQVKCSRPRDSRSNQELKSVMGQPGQSKHSPSSSSISTLLSKISLSPVSTLHDVGESQTSSCYSAVQSVEVESPVILPGIFPEYCWQHINQNQLRRCNQWHEPQKCSPQQYLKGARTSRAPDADLLSRIAQRTVRKSDLHEMDTFGNSTIHISATLFAPPSYLISLIKLGANVNIINNAGQTFLHLLRPETLVHCEDFCYLLELLRVQGFNFRQHDHLGQSPLHLLLRPWIDQDILRKIITKMDYLPIHRHISTARDCFGYTVVGQLNLHGTDSGIGLDHAIFSLSCETENAIFISTGLQTPIAQSNTKENHIIDSQPTRNYENHPCIATVNDLFLYEQHIDYWRTIVASKDSPWLEDSNGRNGLHCLAEASLVTPDMSLPATLLGQLESLKDMGDADNNSDRCCFVKSLLNLGVDPNNYDNNGNTPLMAFIIHCHATETDDSITRILNCLLEAGSDINRRNRQGETALHLAVKLGRRAATKFLLASGVNIHARTSSGLGVLELGHNYSMDCKQDEILFAQIMLCMSLAASFGAVSEPTILDEWGSPELRVITNKISEPKGFKLVKKFIGIQVKGRHWGKILGGSSK